MTDTPSDRGYIGVVNFTDSFNISLVNDEHREELGMSFGPPDKEALFFGALGIFNPAASVGGKIKTEDYQKGLWSELWNRFDVELERATAEVPLLRRLVPEYEDASYSPDEVGLLYEQCIVVKGRTSDEKVISALDTLINASEAAKSKGSGLSFASD